MNHLSESTINLHSPYQVKKMEDGRIEFHTDYGVHYGVEFVEDDTLLSRTAYHLNIVNANYRKSPSDPKFALLMNFSSKTTQLCCIYVTQVTTSSR